MRNGSGIMPWFRRHQKSFFIGTIVILLVGIFVGLGGYLFTSSDMSEAVAAVGNVKIPYIVFQARVERYTDALREQSKGQEITDAQLKELKRNMLRDMVVEQVLAQQAEKLGLRVTDWELGVAIRNTPAFQRDGAFNLEIYFQALRSRLRSTPEEFERQQRVTMLADKLKQLVSNAVKLTPQEIDDEYQRQLRDPKTAEKDKQKFTQNLQQARALDMINYLLRQSVAQMDIRFYLDQREQGG